MLKRSKFRPWSILGLAGICLVLGSSSAVAEMLTITFDAPQYRIIEKSDGSHIIEADEFNYMLTPGKPMLPARTFLIAVPPGARINSVEMIGAGAVELEGTYQILPAPAYAPDNHDPVMVAESQRLWRANRDATYSSDDAYPEAVGQYRGPGQLRKYTFAVVTFTPFSYQPQSGKLSLSQSVTVSIDYTVPGPGEALGPMRMHDHSADRQAAELLVNFDQARPWYTPIAAPSLTMESYDYVIICDDDLLSAATDFANGTNLAASTAVVTISSIDAGYSGIDLAEKVRNFLIEKYSEWGIQWVLLLGDIGDVPMRHCFPDRHNHNPNSNYSPPSDYYYADLTGDWDSDGDGYFGEYGDDAMDFYPELHVGRVPYSDVATVTSILDKILAFQFDMGAWKDNALLLGAFSRFENENGDGYAETDNAVMTEYIASDILGGFSYLKEYEKGGLHVSDYACDYPLTQANAVGQWAAGDYGIVTWKAHGSQYGSYRKYWAWDDGDGIPEDAEFLTEAFIYKSDAVSLDNDHPSIVFSCSCNNGWPEYDNLGKNLLKNGAVGVIPATRVSWYTVGWQNPTWGGSASIDYYFFDYMINSGQRNGEALTNSRIYYYNNFFWWEWQSTQNLYDFNIYGDPYTLREGEEHVDCCEIRGDVNHNGEFNSADVIYFVDYLWKGGPPPPCMDEADANGNGTVNSADVIYMVDYFWKFGPAVVPCP